MVDNLTQVSDEQELNICIRFIIYHKKKSLDFISLDFRILLKVCQVL